MHASSLLIDVIDIEKERLAGGEKEKPIDETVTNPDFGKQDRTQMYSKHAIEYDTNI